MRCRRCTACNTPATDIDRAVAAAREAAGARPAQTTVRRAGGGLDAQAEAAALAAQEFTVVAGVGDEARAAVGQAQSAQVGAGTHWVTVR